MDNVKPRYTATITAQRSRNGHTQSNICMVSVDLSCLRLWAVRVNSAVQRLKICSLQVIPRVLEGRSSYAAKQHKKDATHTSVTCSVSIGPRDGGGFGLAVKMRTGLALTMKLPPIRAMTTPCHAIDPSLGAQVNSTRRRS
jgi:hypothetical protein